MASRFSILSLRAAALLLACAFFSTLQAAEGVIEINQLCAEQSGCFSGDTAGFPVTISAEGSYQLTSNLDVSALPVPEDVTAIEVTVGNVTVDLNGFAILGPVDCVSSPVTSCSPTGGDGYGILTSSLSTDYVDIRNGLIQGMGRHGLWCRALCRMSGLTVQENSQIGIQASDSGSILRNNIVNRNGGAGISGGSMLVNNTVKHNVGDGISVTSGRVVDNVSLSNRGNGIRCRNCLMTGNTASGNHNFGALYSETPASGGNFFKFNVMADESGSVIRLSDSFCSGAICP